MYSGFKCWGKKLGCILLSKQLFYLHELHYSMLHHFTSEGADFTKRISYFLKDTLLFLLKINLVPYDLKHPFSFQSFVCTIKKRRWFNGYNFIPNHIMFPNSLLRGFAPRVLWVAERARRTNLQGEPDGASACPL